MQNSGRSQSLAAGRQGEPAGFSCTSDPLGEGRETTESGIFAESPRERQANPHTVPSSHSVRGQECPSPAMINNIPSPHQALRTAISVGAPRPCTQGAVVGKAAGVWALLKSERTEHVTGRQAGPGGGWEQGSASVPRGGDGDLTWPEPQSHSSPASTKPFPQRAGSPGSPGAGVGDRHAPPPLRKKARSWRRLQALKTRGNGYLPGQGSRRWRRQRPPPNPRLLLRPGPRGSPHSSQDVRLPTKLREWAREGRERPRRNHTQEAMTLSSGSPAPKENQRSGVESPGHSETWLSAFLQKPQTQAAVTLPLLRRELTGSQRQAGDRRRSGVTNLLRLPCGCLHDAAPMLGGCLGAASFGVMAEAQAVAYLVGHGGCCADGEFRMVLRSEASLRTTNPARARRLPGPRRSLPCSPLRSSQHDTYPPQAPGPPWCPGRCAP